MTATFNILFAMARGFQVSLDTFRAIGFVVGG